MDEPPPFFELQPATLSDLSQLGVMEKACFPLDAWPLIEQIGVLVLPGSVRIKAVYTDRMIGFVSGDIQKKRNTGWISTISVLPEFRRMGVGEALLLACEKEMRMYTVRLAVRKSNLSAQMLYRKNGYQQTETWAHYYEGGEDAIVMEKNLLEYKP
jgi:ribosomal protein S18 acetylase RimI-like enzyme